jgi:hypothetical protein
MVVMVRWLRASTGAAASGAPATRRRIVWPWPGASVARRGENLKDRLGGGELVDHRLHLGLGVGHGDDLAIGQHDAVDERNVETRRRLALVIDVDRRRAAGPIEGHPLGGKC